MAWLGAAAAAQRGRTAVLGPVALGLGAAGRLEGVLAGPTLAYLLATPALIGLALIARRPRAPSGRAVTYARTILGVALAWCAWASLGLLAADLRVARLEAPRLERPVGPVIVEGFVQEVQAGERRARMLVRVASVEGLDEPPRLVLISPPAGTALPPGRAVRCRAMLRPPEDPLVPGAYDLARRLFFARIGATGFSLGACRPTELAPPPGLSGALVRLQAMRRDITDAIAAAAPGRGGAVAAAVITGDRSLMDAATNAALGDSGLAHLLSVSGLHMGLAGGLAFAALQIGLALAPRLALVLNVRKAAAVGALIAVAAYLALSGASVPAQRAFVMTAVAFGAVLVDRPALTMRSLAAAGVLVILLAPESVLEAGFQMSFAATAALIAAFEARPHRAPLPSPGPVVGALQNSWGAIAAVLLVSFVAGLATDPIAAFHFQRLAIYGLPANLAASPIVSLLVAPAALAAAVATPLGWDGPLQVAAWGLDLVVGVGEAFASRPEAIRFIPAASAPIFGLTLAGLGWCCIWRGPIRFLGAAPMAAALALYLATPPPALIISGDQAALWLRARSAEGGEWLYWRASRGGRFASERLAQRVGVDPRHLALRPQLPCGPAHCRWTTLGGRGAAYALSEAGFDPACKGVSLLISRVPVPASARRVCDWTHVVDAAELARRGGAEVREGRRGFTIRFVRDGAARPWRLESRGPETPGPLDGSAEPIRLRARSAQTSGVAPD